SSSGEGVRSRSGPALFRLGLRAPARLPGEGVGILERIAYERLNRLLRHVALHAEIAPRGYVIEHLSAAIDVVRCAHGNCLRERCLGPGMAIQALVEILVYLIAVDAVRNDRRLQVIVARAPGVVVDGVTEQRWLRGFGNRQGAAHRVDHCRRGFGEGPQADQPERQKRAGDPSGESGLLPHTLTILTA